MPGDSSNHPLLMSISYFQGWFVCIIIIYQKKIFLQYANSVDLDQTPHSGTSDLVLHCLPMSLFYGMLGIYGFIKFYILKFRILFRNN